jgi:hypothetical protein
LLNQIKYVMYGDDDDDDDDDGDDDGDGEVHDDYNNKVIIVMGG